MLLTLISCGNEAEQSTQELIDSADVDGLNKSIWNGQSNRGASQRTRFGYSCSQPIGYQQKTSTGICRYCQTQRIKTSYFFAVNCENKSKYVVATRIYGAVSSISVREGQQVKKGQILMRIDDGGLKQAIRLQKAQTDLAKTVFERQERLWNEQIGSEIEYLQAKTNYESQRSQLGQLNDQLEKAIVRAPFSGKIDHIMVDVGQVVSPGTMPLIRLVSTKEMYVEADVPERYLLTVSKGTPVRVDVPVLNTSFDGLYFSQSNTCQY